MPIFTLLIGLTFSVLYGIVEVACYVVYGAFCGVRWLISD